MATISMPGWPRRLAVIFMSLGLALICFALVIGTDQNDLALAMEILALSIGGFTLVTFLSFDAMVLWRMVDYPWVLAAFATILFSLVKVADTVELDKFTAAKTEVISAFSAMTYAVESTITNDCQVLASRLGMWKPSPEPYSGACDRIRHFRPKMGFRLDEFSQSLNVTYLSGLAMDMSQTNENGVGSWQGIKGQADRFLEVASRNTSVIETWKSIQAETGFFAGMRHSVQAAEVRYWYFMMAFFVGLRLSKTTAEVLQSRPKKPAEPTSPRRRWRYVLSNHQWRVGPARVAEHAVTQDFRALESG